MTDAITIAVETKAILGAAFAIVSAILGAVVYLARFAIKAHNALLDRVVMVEQTLRQLLVQPHEYVTVERYGESTSKVYGRLNDLGERVAVLETKVGVR